MINIQYTPKHVRFSDKIGIHVVEIEDRKGYWIEDMLTNVDA